MDSSRIFQHKVNLLDQYQSLNLLVPDHTYHVEVSCRTLSTPTALDINKLYYLNR